MVLIRHEDNQLATYRESQRDEIIAYEPGLSLIDWDGDRSGSTQVIILGDGVGHAGETPDEDATSWIRSWSQSGWERFDAAYREVRTKTDASGIEVVIRPSAHGMLSDAVCTLNWIARGAGQDTKLLLDPMGWVVPSMMRDLEDHLDRIVELCLEMAAQGHVWGVLLRSVAWNEDRSALVASALDSGEPDKTLLIKKLSPLLESCPIQLVVDPADVSAVS
jgi:hypothetical protein